MATADILVPSPLLVRSDACLIASLADQRHYSELLYASVDAFRQGKRYVNFLLRELS